MILGFSLNFFSQLNRNKQCKLTIIKHNMKLRCHISRITNNYRTIKMKRNCEMLKNLSSITFLIKIQRMLSLDICSNSKSLSLEKENTSYQDEGEENLSAFLLFQVIGQVCIVFNRMNLFLSRIPFNLYILDLIHKLRILRTVRSMLKLLQRIKKCLLH